MRERLHPLKEKAALTRSRWWQPGVLVALLSIGAAGFIACGGDHDHEEGKETGATCPTTQTLTYENFGKAFMMTYCLRCHSESVTGAARMNAPADHNFDTVADIKTLAEHIDEHAGSGPKATNTEMPPSGTKPSIDDRKKLSEWLACGAP